MKDELRAQLYLRVMGNELAFGTLDGSDLKKLRAGKARSFLDDLVKRLVKDGEVSVTQSAVVLDTTMVIPTGQCLPAYVSEMRVVVGVRVLGGVGVDVGCWVLGGWVEQQG